MPLPAAPLQPLPDTATRFRTPIHDRSLENPTVKQPNPGADPSRARGDTRAAWLERAVQAGMRAATRYRGGR